MSGKALSLNYAPASHLMQTIIPIFDIFIYTKIFVYKFEWECLTFDVTLLIGKPFLFLI